MLLKLVALACCMQAANCIAQIRLSVDYYKKPLYYVVSDLQKQLGRDDWRYDACFRHTKPITYKKNNELLETILEHVFEDQPLEGIVLNNTFVVVPRDVHGRVTDENGKPLEGVTIKGISKYVYTDRNGFFHMRMGACDSIFIFTCVNSQTHKELVRGRTWIDVIMKIKHEELEEKNIYNNGYFILPAERAPGAFVNINEQEYKRQVSSNATAGMEYQASGMQFNKNILAWKNQPFIELRGASTIHAGTGPLIVIDNFPVQSVEVLQMINPQDIKSITILKDAAATSLWGSRAGNGVIIITTMSGRYGQSLRFFATNSISITAMPDLWYMPALSSSEYIEMEKERFYAGCYANTLGNPWAPRSPVLEILSSGVPDTEKERLLQSLRDHDVRHELQDLFYRKAITNRHFISMRGGQANMNYFLSAGYDGEQQSLVTARRQRFTNMGALRVKRNRLEVGLNTYFSYEIDRNNVPPPGGLYPFSKLKRPDGGAETVNTDIRQIFKDSMEQYLQDWDYRPLEELQQRQRKQKTVLYRLGLTGTYTFSSNFNLNLVFQHDQHNVETADLNTATSYYARNIQNSFATINNDHVDYIIPRGGILNWQRSQYSGNKARVQFNYKTKPHKLLQIAALAGAEVSAVDIDTTAITYYGFYGDRRLIYLDYNKLWPQSYEPGKTALIPHMDNTSSSYDFFASYYTNGAIIYKNRYTLSLSGRYDRSNLFGAKTNRRSIPLGSIGFKWDLSEESFYHLDEISHLSLRASYGFSGNVSKATTAYISAVGILGNQDPTYAIINPANPRLRWEKSKMLNVGFSLSDKDHHYNLSFDYYFRQAADLTGPGRQDPILGMSSVWGNYAALNSKGFDLTLSTEHRAGDFIFQNLLLINQAVNKVSSYYNTHTDAAFFVDNSYLRPLTGYPVYPLFGFRWAGLDTATGDPMGLLKGNATTKYNDIFEASSDSLVYKGSAVPTTYASLRPAISWNDLTLSFTIAGKFGYYFRRGSINYLEPYSNPLAGPNDFSKRFIPGSFVNTDVPSLKPNPDGNREQFYRLAEVLIEKGDHIRLHDVRLDFNCRSILPKALKLNSMTAFLYAANLGIIWRANKVGVDPDFQLGPPQPMSFTTGVSFEF